MSLLKPFRAIMPTPMHAPAVAAPPYDVLSSAEARARAADDPQSFLHVSKPEIDLPEGTAADDPSVYAKAGENMARLMGKGVMALTGQAHFYVYRAEIGGHVQTGVAGAASVKAYREGRIRRHELTRPDKVADRARQIEAVSAHTGPVMLAYRDDAGIAAAVAAVAANPPTLRADVDGVAHTVWIAQGEEAKALAAEVAGLETLYIADGHHRSEAAAHVAEQRGRTDAGFLSVGFPESEMRILDYNRVVRDLNGRTADELIAALAPDFEVAPSDTPARPARAQEFGLYVDGRWYRLTLKAPPPAGGDPTGTLDAAILSASVLAPCFGIEDLRRDARIDFVGGSRGLEGLEARVDSGEMAAAFALYPTRLAQLFAVADADLIMPPKSTWFEPKLADGLLSLPLED